MDVKVVDPEGRTLPAGSVGQVICRGPVVTKGYWQNPAATADALSDGWLHTGDLGMLDGDGYLTLKGRLQDVVSTERGTIYPRDTEEVVLAHPSVRDVAVVASSAESGQHLVAFLCLEDGAQVVRAELDALCAERLPEHQRPGDYEVLDSLPMNAYGKVLKTALREALSGRKGAEARLASPWRAYDGWSSDGFRTRVASSMTDAAAIRDVLHNAWNVDESEDYFYDIYNNPEALYKMYIKPTLASADIRPLDVLCLVGEQRDGRITCTYSLVLNHQQRTVELGRAAVAKDAQGKHLLIRFVSQTRRILKDHLADYAVVADVTSLARGAAASARAMGCRAVAVHPSSFVVQPGATDKWIEKLSRFYGADLAQALLWKSDRTGLGRFGTSYYIAFPEGRPTYAPFLTDLQQPAQPPVGGGGRAPRGRDPQAVGPFLRQLYVLYKCRAPPAGARGPAHSFGAIDH